MRQTFAFTLVELLVVISIIVVLLALLSPALDKAVYEAELAVCATRQKALVGAATTYAVDHQRAYPSRRGHAHPFVIGTAPSLDLITPLKHYADHGIFIDPLCAKHEPAPEASDPGTYIYSNYSVYLGWGRPVDNVKPARRLGQVMEFDPPDDPALRRFAVLVADHDSRLVNDHVLCSHPDKDGLMHIRDEQNTNAFGLPTERYTFSWWQFLGDDRRGMIDTRYGLSDGSVAQLSNVVLNDARLAKFPFDTLASYNIDRKVQLPQP